MRTYINCQALLPIIVITIIIILYGLTSIFEIYDEKLIDHTEYVTI